MHFEIKKYLDDSVLYLKIPVRLASEISGELKNILKEQVGEGNYKIVLDLVDTNYMDSSGIGAIVSKIAVTRSHKGDIRLANAGQYITDLLELTHINKIIKSYDTIDEAVNSFKE